MIDQLDLFAVLDAGLCSYGGKPGEKCRRPATHRAEWWTDRQPFHGGKDCCLDHANYYADGWLWPGLFYPGCRDAVAMRPIGTGR